MMSKMAPGEPLPLIDLPASEPKRGLGTLTVSTVAGKVRLPLSAVNISADVADRVASVTIEQTFSNSYTDHLEAVYIFPMSAGCAVSRFEMRVGSRVIVGKVEERGEARKQYQQALDDGKRAALLEQDRDDVFTVQVGNLPPGEEVTVLLTYSERLPFFEDGKTEVRLPLVVAPRYIPGNELDRDSVGDGTECDTDIVPDASRISPPRLVKGFDPQVGLKISVELLANSEDGSSLSDFMCSQHAVRIGAAGEKMRFELARTDERLDRDFVLRWRLAANAVKSSILTYRHADGNTYAMLSIFPPKRDGYLGAARDVVFVLDRSGSMQGMKMTSAARACSILLATLGPRDRFAIQAFDSVREWLHPPGAKNKFDLFQAADEAGIERGEKYLRDVTARGGTEVDGALADALEAISQRSESDGRVPVIVLLTDGEVGDESRILKRVQTELGDSRLFTVGIDTAVNDGLLRRVANLGGGTATFVEPGTALEEALQAVGREIGTPLVVDLHIDSDEVEAGSISPARIPDLYAGRAVTVFFRTSGKANVRIKGKFADGAAFSEAVKARKVDLNAISQLWAKHHIVDLEDNFRVNPSLQADLRAKIVDLAVMHSLLTRFTAFVVVDETEVVNAHGTVRKIVQPVENPAGWDMLNDQFAAGGGAVTQGIAPTAAWGQMSPHRLMAAPEPSAAPAPAPQPSCDQSWGSPAPQSVPPPPPPGSGGGWNFPDVLFSRTNANWFDALKELGGKETLKKGKRATGGSNAIAEAFKHFCETIERLLSQVKSGTLPGQSEGAVLEKARKDLIGALASDELGTKVPNLQKFLRGAAVELVASLKEKQLDLKALTALWERHNQLFALSKNEFSTASADGACADFWESSV
jgi:Ca-activated chloride channel family protein